MPGFHSQYLIVLLTAVAVGMTNPMPAAGAFATGEPPAVSGPKASDYGPDLRAHAGQWVVQLSDNTHELAPLISSVGFDDQLACDASLGNLGDVLKSVAATITNPQAPPVYIKDADADLARLVGSIVVQYTTAKHHPPDFSIRCVQLQ